jgi:ssDNA-binding Zn-finger/Zn-ribbon topoisomerase 1
MMETFVQPESVMKKCPNCKHLIQLRTADFIKEIAMVSCMDCRRDAFTIEETLLNVVGVAI